MSEDKLSSGDQSPEAVAALITQDPGAIQPVVECKGIRATTDFPRDITGLSPTEIEHHYKAMRNSHASLTRSRGQLMRRSRELTEARERFLTTLRSYEERLVLIGQEKAEAMRLAQEMHQELEAFDSKQQALDKLLRDLEEAKQESGFWSIFQINDLLDRMKAVLRGGNRSNG
jgi:prefoldin subunit 5